MDEDGWISVSERLPYYGQWCVGYNEKNKFRSDILPYFTFQAHEQAPEFTHWIPLCLPLTKEAKKLIIYQKVWYDLEDGTNWQPLPKEPENG